MNADAELYQQVILDHNKSPRNFARLPTATHHARGDNPLCGDRYEIYLEVDGEGRIQRAGFEGSGCAISKASASLMTEALTGKTVAEANALFSGFHDLVRGKDKQGANLEALGKLRVFSGVWEYPARIKCAILSWHAMQSALAGPGSDTSVTSVTSVTTEE